MIPRKHLFIPDIWVQKVCRVGQTDLACKYLGMGENGFFCTKTHPKLKAQVDDLADHFIAKGDNCGGIEMVDFNTIRNN